jgi:DNA-directed RNA polymerase specialized sigma24 family protein
MRSFWGAPERMPALFDLSYRRHVHGRRGYLTRRVGSAELAADLTAEAFAAALLSAPDFDARRGPASAWLYRIARLRARLG